MPRLLCLLLVVLTTAVAHAVGIDVNGSFERTEGINASFVDGAAGSQINLSPRFPQVWQVNTGALAARKTPHALRLIEDADRAHSGRFALELTPGEVFLPALPVRPGARVTLRFFATGKASAMFGAWGADSKARNLYPPATPVGDGKPDAKGYVEYVHELPVPDGATNLSVTLGAADGLVDDVSLDVADTALSAPDLTASVAADGQTLLLANGDAPLPAGGVFTGAQIDGALGKAYQVGAEDLLQVPGKLRALLQGGTIELWFRPHWPGRDDKQHQLVGLSMDGFGYSLSRSQYNHIAFGGSDGWTNGTGEVQAQHWQYGNRWDAGDWHHVAVSWTPTWYTLFVDGYPVDSALSTTPPGPNRSWCSGRLPSKLPTMVALGSPGTDIDEVRISSSARYYIAAGAAPQQPAPLQETVAETGPVAAPEPPQPTFDEPVPPARDTPVEFFVAGEDPTASDDNPGTADKPFRTISRGVKELRPGDTLTVRGGTYREGVEIDLVGSAEHPITVRAAAAEQPLIKGSEIVKGWVRDGAVWRKDGWTDEYVRGQFAKGTGLVSANVMEVYQEDGAGGDAVVLFRVRTPEELREGKCYWDEATGTITIWPYDRDGTYDPNVQGVEVPVRGRALTVGRRFVRVQGFRMRQFGMAAVTNWPSAGLHGADCSMEDCTIAWADFGGLSVSGFRQVLRGCEGSYCGNSGLGAGVGEEILIEDCRFTHNNFWRYSPGWHGGAAKLIPWFNKSTVRNSEFAYSYGPGLWFDGSCNGSVIEGNRCHDNEGPGIMVEISRGCIVRNNLCYNNRNSQPGIDLMPVEGKGYAPVNCRASRVEGGSGGQGIFVSSSPDTRVYGNLCYRNEDMGIFAEWGRRQSSDVADWVERKGVDVVMSTHGVDVQGNILVNNGSAQLSVRRNGVDEDTYDNHSDYNLLFSGQARPLVVWGFGGAVFTKLDKWQAASGFDTHSLVGAPAFEFSPGMDFRLQPDSPGVDQGPALPELPADAVGVKRPQGAAPDIGPYEIAGTRRIVERPQVPTNVTYFQVDLSPFMNREFADELADDGKGGWSDQGPTTDLRSFPTGEQTFNGVPFRVLAPKGCVVLRSPFRPQSQDLPVRVTIPVKHRADVLYFLHSGAWLGSGTHHWSYIIHRGDGTQETIRVEGGENIRDWSAPNPDLPFDREYPTTTTVAWTGSNQTFEKVSVYMMAWVNPSTWCDVTDVEMVATGEGGVPALIAITGGELRK